MKKNGKAILRRKDLHWWLTGFKLGEFSEPNALTMDAAITFPNRQMRDAFADSLIRIGYSRSEFSVRMKTVSIHYTKPHSPQTESRNKVRSAIVQKTNHSNCYLYETATREYTHTLDKLEYIKAMVPELYTLFMDSLYAKGIYEAFGWIKVWLGHKNRARIPNRRARRIRRVPQAAVPAGSAVCPQAAVPAETAVPTMSAVPAETAMSTGST